MPKKKKIAKKGRKLPGPWRIKNSTISDKFEIRTRHGELDVRTFREVTYVRKTSDWFYEHKVEVQTGPNLNEMLQSLRVTDKQDALVILMRSGLDILQKLFQRFLAKERRMAEAYKIKRRKARAAEKVLRDAEFHKKQCVKMKDEGKYVRRLDV